MVYESNIVYNIYESSLLHSVYSFQQLSFVRYVIIENFHIEIFTVPCFLILCMIIFSEQNVQYYDPPTHTQFIRFLCCIFGVSLFLLWYNGELHLIVLPMKNKLGLYHGHFEYYESLVLLKLYGNSWWFCYSNWAQWLDFRYSFHPMGYFPFCRSCFQCYFALRMKEWTSEMNFGVTLKGSQD